MTPSPTPNLLQRLKDETSQQHTETEAMLFTPELMAGMLTPDQYGDLLRIHYQFHQALETALAHHADFLAGYDWQERRKTPWLTADLDRLQCPLPPPVPGLFAGWSGYELLGALYVSEGSTLGGRYIAKSLRRIPELQDEAVRGQFFTGYGEQTGAHWKAFGAFLLQRADTDHTRIIDAARRTFAYFQQLARQRVGPISVA